ncbi:MAG: NusG domain II-containing protein [Candidatus Omnitrophica bacterium]|nr:NusG domain II-containing protein [Candidatus Omnitrophota bacterium]
MRKNPSQDPDFYKRSKFDLILITLVLFFSVFCVTRLSHSQQSQPGKLALIYEKNKLLEKISLDKEGMITLLNGKMQIEVRKGKIRVRQADCPQHLCVNMGWIQYGGQTITCVPNKVSIEVKSNGLPLIDAVAN